MEFTEVLSKTDFVAMVFVMLFIVLDLISGFVKAIIEENVRSRKMFEGIMRKTAYILVLALAVACQAGAYIMPLEFSFPLVIPACVLIIATEITSIWENIVAINPTLGGNGLADLFNQHSDKE